MNKSLEGVRGAAALLVVFFHMGLILPDLAATRNGYFSVDLFFVLSGFVIAGAYAARLTDTREAFAFMVRRVGRLWPAHIVASALCVAVPVGMLALVHADAMRFVPNAREALAIVTFAQGLHTVTRDVGTAVSWSASDELYVYALFATVCVTVRARAAAFAVLAALGYAIAVSTSAGACARDACYSMTFDYGWSRCIAGFFLGAIIAEFRGPLGRLTRHQWPALVATLAVFAFADRSPIIAFSAPVVFAALVASLARDSGPVARLFQSRPTQYLGRLSYALYLGHAVLRYPFSVIAIATHSYAAHAAAVAAMLLLSLGIAHVLHHRIETPWRARFAQWSAREPSIEAVPCK